MPRYVYKCLSCDVIYETSHAFKKDPDACPECQEIKFLQKQLTTPISFVKKKDINKGEPVGSIVEEAIEENREQLRQQKEQLKREVKK